MAIRLRVYPQYNSWSSGLGYGYGMGLSTTSGLDRVYRRRMRAQQRMIAREQRMFNLHLRQQQIALQRQLASWNQSSAMHAATWGVPALTGLSYLPGTAGFMPYPYGMTQAAWAGYRPW